MQKSFAEYSTRVEEHLERVYAIRVVSRDFAGTFFGDLDGAEIHIASAVTPEQRLFLLAHLFGHTVQWNVDVRAFDLGQQYQYPVDRRDLPAIVSYEREAASSALEMLHEAGITDVDRWFSDYAACDEAYLLHYYGTGEKREFLSFWRDHAPLVQPISIPLFTPTRKRFRLQGVVI